jgi:uracil-DNA glycosylase
MFAELFQDERLIRLQDSLSKELSDGHTTMFPYPELLFNAFCLTPLDKLKVVILGQDPYFESDNKIPQAMGLSFSVPHGFAVPSSLKSIYSNMHKYKQIKKIHNNGNLEFWAVQGCLMINSALTVIEGKDNINCHKQLWKWFTDRIIKFISFNTENTIFVLWGGSAIEKIPIINLDKHEIVTSSHPSGLSAPKPFKEHPAFNDFDHFGTINKMLAKFKREPIIW